MSGLVVVGVDGSATALAAVETAAQEAQWRGARLRLVYAFVLPTLYAPLGPSTLDAPGSGLRESVGRLLTEAEERAAGVAPDVQATQVLVEGDPLTVLEEQSRTADLVVVGSRGLGGFLGLIVGSTAVRLAARARCPVVVVREQVGGTGPILLGIDGSPAGAAAIDFAFAEAELRGAALRAVHCWTTWNAPMPPPQDESMPYANEPGALEAGEKRLLSEALAGRREKFPAVRVEPEVVRGGTREALIEASRSAQLLVVGARGRGGFTGLLLGSVSQAMLHHAHCTVAVARDTGSRR
ncbi:universal stress protein [Streptomyces sp. SCSIO ZS0520]|uniref:universal stress protein n=1 Tax=Streptomyces sp. SCSIO ZS0520 TaxID=2892996 RepID=UPI0021D91C03|nr:universal stress protein [Streptomyces sp. SCSIO ZS0520]